MIPPNTDLNADAILISGKEMRQILALCGYSQTKFANMLGKSVSYINRILSYERPFLPFDTVWRLEALVEPHNFHEALHQIRTGEARKSLPAKYIKDMFKVAGRSFSEYAREHGVSHSFINELVTRYENAPSICFFYIDYLIGFFGKEHYEVALGQAKIMDEKRQAIRQGYRKQSEERKQKQAQRNERRREKRKMDKDSKRATIDSSNA